MEKRKIIQYVTDGGVSVRKGITEVGSAAYREKLLEDLDREKGAYYCSNFEYPGRYSRWDIGFLRPAMEITAKGNRFRIEGLSEKGRVLLKMIFREMKEHPHMAELFYEKGDRAVSGQIKIEAEASGGTEHIAEENRSKRPSIFSLIRGIQKLFFHQSAGEDSSEFLGLYGAYGYELVFQFEKVERNKNRIETGEDIHLFLPDEIFVIDHRLNKGFVLNYDFQKGDLSTEQIEKENTMKEPSDYRFGETEKSGEGERKLINEKEGAYGEMVRRALPSFLRGDFFEVVPSHVLKRECGEKPSALFRELLSVNPSPYGFLINLGKEHLIGASPEMYVRVEGQRVETCPISGTIKRGADAVEDYENIMKLLNSEKEESELTMCTDVDRNDKSRICKPGTVRIIGRRQLELYSHLIHTVDHVEGQLREGFDGIDAFMTHMWAVTVTGAPKKAAMNWIEKNEESGRGWYGGAVGLIGFDGNVNTGLTLRTICLKNSMAEIRVGATVLYGSDPESEEKETLTKGAALLEVIRRVSEKSEREAPKKEETAFCRKKPKLLLVDHEDSFVHTLGNYFRAQGAEVMTIRHDKALEIIRTTKPELVVLSPGPGKPEDFRICEVLKLCEEMDLAIFGICLGMQGIIEYYGGALGILEIPRHGKSSEIEIMGENQLFRDLESPFRAGRYHSLYGQDIPTCLKVVGQSKEDRLPMAVEHREKKVFGVQFHPESLMTMKEKAGEKIIRNVLEALIP